MANRSMPVSSSNTSEVAGTVVNITPTPSSLPPKQTSLEPNSHTTLNVDVTNTYEPPQIILVEYDELDVDNPHNWSSSKKLTISLCVALTGWSVIVSSTIYGGCYNAIQQHFVDATPELITCGLAMYVLGFACGPLIFAPISEVYGRLIVYHISFPICIIWLLCCIFAPNISSLIIFRFLASCFGGSVFSNAAMISDLYLPKQRGKIMTLFITAQFLATLGPLIGGYTSEYGGFEWGMAMECFIVFGCYIIGSLFMRETYQPVLLQRKANLLNKYNTNRTIIYKTATEMLDDSVGHHTTTRLYNVLHRAMTRPFMLLFHEPIILALSTWTAIVYGVLYLTLNAYPIVFTQQRGFTPGQTGLAYIAISIGVIVAALSIFYVFNSLYIRNVNQQQPNHTKTVTPELRLPMACIGALCFPVSLFSFAWLTQSDIHYMAPICVMSLFGLGILLTFLSVQNYLVDCYPLYAASALAANNVYRSIVGAVFPLFATQLYVGLGVQWATTLIAFLSLACVPIPFVLLRYGHVLRSRSKYSDTSVVSSTSSNTQTTEQIEDAYDTDVMK